MPLFTTIFQTCTKPWTRTWPVWLAINVNNILLEPNRSLSERRPYPTVGPKKGVKTTITYKFTKCKRPELNFSDIPVLSVLK